MYTIVQLPYAGFGLIVAFDRRYLRLAQAGMEEYQSSPTCGVRISVRSGKIGALYGLKGHPNGQA